MSAAGAEAQGDPRRACAVLLVAAFALHNLEEVLTFGRYRAAAARGFAGGAVRLPDPAAAWVVLGLLTLLGAGVAAWAERGPDTRPKQLALRASAAVLLLNLFVPHLPAAAVLGGYAPGVATAVLVNVPVACLVLARLRRRRAGGAAA